MRTNQARLAFFFTMALLSACSERPAKNDEMTAIDIAAIDSKTNPCADFYQFACGGWLARTAIPNDRPQWSRGFAEIEERNVVLLDRILKDYASGENSPENPYSKKLGDFYSSCMDEAKAETASMETLSYEIKKIEELESKEALIPLLARLHLIGVDALFDLSREQDLKDPEQMIAAADQGGLGLPDRDYYLKKDKRTASIQKMYRDHIRAMFVLAGTKQTEAVKQASKIFDIETKLAKASLSRVERRDPEKIYHRLERVGLEHLAPAISWAQYFNALGYPQIQSIDVKTPHFFEALQGIVKRTRLEDLKTYLRWHLLASAAPGLPRRFVEEDFQFHSRAFFGQKSLPARWKRCVRATESGMGFAIGRSFVDAAYGKKGKKVSNVMMKGVEKAMHASIERLSWMDQPTRSEALRKLSRVVNQVGYPNRWRSYDSLEIDRRSYLANRFATTRFNEQHELDQIGKPVDREEWEMPPATVNAYYDASLNQMVFPAGIFQRPFFAANAPDYANYGGIGMVMGHELTHGFDDEGRKFDAGGHLRDWWSPEVAKEFDKRAACVAKQYDAFQVQPGIHVNGRLTLGENIADMGGVKMAYAAWLEARPGSTERQAQDFFIHFAQSWCTKTSPELERLLVTVDPHSPPKMRVNGSLTNFIEFSSAFKCSAGSQMYGADRCVVW